MNFFVVSKRILVGPVPRLTMTVIARTADLMAHVPMIGRHVFLCQIVHSHVVVAPTNSCSPIIGLTNLVRPTSLNRLGFLARAGGSEPDQ